MLRIFLHRDSFSDDSTLVATKIHKFDTSDRPTGLFSAAVARAQPLGFNLPSFVFVSFVVRVNSFAATAKVFAFLSSPARNRTVHSFLG